MNSTKRPTVAAQRRRNQPKRRGIKREPIFAMLHPKTQAVVHAAAVAFGTSHSWVIATAVDVFFRMRLGPRFDDVDDGRKRKRAKRS